jgi:hypothetical protein
MGLERLLGNVPVVKTLLFGTRTRIPQPAIPSLGARQAD